MRYVPGVFSMLNRPLPAWLTLSLFLGATAIAAPTVFNGSLHLLKGATIADDNAPADACIETNASRAYTYAGGPCAATSIDNNFSASQTIAVKDASSNFNLTQSNPEHSAIATITGSGIGVTQNNFLQFNTTASAKPNYADQVGELDFRDSGYLTGSHGDRAAKIWGGIAGATAKDSGGYIVFWTKGDGAHGGEAMVIDPQQHIFFANPDAAFRLVITTPASCNALQVCGTSSYSFTKTFYSTDGRSGETPYCPSAQVYDATTPSDVWLVSIEHVSDTAVKYNYAAMRETTGAKTLYLYGSCFDAAY